MNIIPVLDLMNGQVVHAKHGNRHEYLPIKSALTDSSEPLAVVQAILALYPFKQFYIADINAIQKTGNHKNTILEITKNFPQLEIWLDAGFCNEAVITSYQSRNIKPVLGSESLSSIGQYQTLSAASEHMTILSLDYKDDRFHGIQDILSDASLWPNDVIVMTLNKVGSNAGPDLAKLASIKAQSKLSNIYAAGGVRNSADLEAIRDLNMTGALVASALHNGALTHQQIKQLID
jgi:phosphoribosylformimino-5-aminoimidazole carboxamide ribotide isomerase